MMSFYEPSIQLNNKVFNTCRGSILILSGSVVTKDVVAAANTLVRQNSITRPVALAVRGPPVRLRFGVT